MKILKLNVDKLLSDINLSGCSTSANGVYFRLLLLFHRSEVYGGILIDYLPNEKMDMINDNLTKISRQLCINGKDFVNGINELIQSRVLMIEPRGDKFFLFDPQMVYDHKLSQIRSDCGKKGGGNPIVKQTPRAVELTIVPDTLPPGQPNTKTKSKSEKTNYTDSDFIKDLIGLGADEELARLWIMVRKKKKLLNSPVVIKEIPKRLTEINMGINEALEFLVNKSWGGMETKYFKSQETPYAPRIYDRKKNEQTKLDLSTYSKASNL